eukprot:569484-Amphidinium_carterae.1
MTAVRHRDSTSSLHFCMGKRVRQSFLEGNVWKRRLVVCYCADHGVVALASWVRWGLAGANSFPESDDEQMCIT